MNYINIKDYGAKSNGELCTKEIQAALDYASQSNGAMVVIPVGEFITGTLNIGCASIYLEKGAILKGSPNIEDYVFNGYHHNEMGQTLALIYSLNNNNISIMGEGTIDLNSNSFYDMNSATLPNCSFELSEKQKAECTRKYIERPNQPIFFYNCNHIRIQNIKIINSPCWTMSYVECQDIHVTDITIDNSMCIPNNDGMHFCSCNKVFVRGCNIKSGDDCIALTGITDWNKPCEDVVISDCILSSSSKAIAIGYMHSIIRNVCINNCIILDSNRALVIMTSSHTGLVENVQVCNVRLDTRIRAGNWWGNGEAICIMGTYHNNSSYALAIPDRNIPVNIRNIKFQNIICSTENALGIVGEGENVRDIYFNNISVEIKDSENILIKGRLIDLSPGEQVAQLPNEEPYWLHIQGVKNVTIRDASIYQFHEKQPKVSQKDCENISIEENVNIL